MCVWGVVGGGFVFIFILCFINILCLFLRDLKISQISGPESHH